MRYYDRQDAGQRLARRLKRFENNDIVVLALPRGGIVLGVEVARVLGAPLGLVLVRKIGHPAYSEYAIGAVAEEEAPIYNEDELLGIDKAWLKSAVASARQLIEHRHELYYEDGFVPPNVEGKTVILVDDGIATGLTMKAAVRAVQNKQAKRVIVAVPVASQESVGTLETIADEVIVLDDPRKFLGAVGAHYQQFEQVDDEEVRTLLWGIQNHVLETTAKPIRH